MNPPPPHLDDVAVRPPVLVQRLGARPLSLSGRRTCTVTAIATTTGCGPLARLLGLAVPTTTATRKKRTLLVPHHQSTAGLVHEGRHGGGKGGAGAAAGRGGRGQWSARESRLSEGGVQRGGGGSEGGGVSRGSGDSVH